MHPALLKGVYLAHFDRPFKIQEAAIPLILAGHGTRPHRECLLAQAKSGSGKTAAFALGMLQSINLSRPEPQAICVCPTRELTIQNYECVRQLGSVMVEECGLRVHVAVKEERPEGGRGSSRGGRGGRGAPPREQVTAHIVVGTPGKLLSMTRAKTLATGAVTMLVLDEADVMDQGGGRDDTRSIRQALPENTQVLCFSATYTDSVIRDIEQTLFKRHASSKVRIAEAEDENRQGLMVREIAHVWCDAAEHPGGKLGIVEDIFDILSAQQSIIFVNTRNEVRSITDMLREKSFSVADLSGQLSTSERDAVMRAFRDGKVKVLITTNVLARGIDVPGVNIVINYDLPVLSENFSQNRSSSSSSRGGNMSNKAPKPDTDTYIHRVGRSGRAGARGVAINLVDDAKSSGLDAKILAAIETKCFGPQPAPWTMIKKVPDASDIEAIKEMAKKHLADTSSSS